MKKNDFHFEYPGVSLRVALMCAGIVMFAISEPRMFQEESFGSALIYSALAAVVLFFCGAIGAVIVEVTCGQSKKEKPGRLPHVVGILVVFGVLMFARYEAPKLHPVPPTVEETRAETVQSVSDHILEELPSIEDETSTLYSYLDCPSDYDDASAAFDALDEIEAKWDEVIELIETAE